jgi:sugar/nucleoside kinase (ribokinase family)
MTRRGILTGGTWCADHNKLVDIWPAEDGRANILAAETSGGGSGFNLAVAVKKLDPAIPVATIGIVGDDPDGRLLLKEAERFGIDRRQLRTTNAAQTDYTDAFASAATGRRTHISYFGTSHLLTPDHFDFSQSSHRILHLGLPGIHDLMDAPQAGEANGWVIVLKKARAAQLATNMELASIAPRRLGALVRPCLPYLDLLVVNDHEIGGIADIETVKDGRTQIGACRAAAETVLSLGTPRIVVVHFPAGAICVTRDGTAVTRPSVSIPPAEIVGANGAGDAFAAGFLYAWHEDRTIEEALALAHAAAAASLRQVTTTGAIESSSQCLALAEKWGWREAID